MNSIIARGYRSINVGNLRGRYKKRSIIAAGIPNHKNGHYVRPNRVIIKYPNFKKDVDRNVHVKMFNFIMKVDVETSKKYIINAFNYMLKDTTSDWCHNYMLEFFNCIISELTHAFYKCH